MEIYRSNNWLFPYGRTQPGTLSRQKVQQPYLKSAYGHGTDQNDENLGLLLAKNCENSTFTGRKWPNMADMMNIKECSSWYARNDGELDELQVDSEL
jgi:hypothetical protein